MIGSVRKEKGADQDIGLECLTQNWHFLTFPEHFWRHAGIRSEILMHFAAQYPLSIRWEPVEYYPPKNTPAR